MIGVSTIKELSTTKVEGYTWDCVNVYVGYKKKKKNMMLLIVMTILLNANKKHNKNDKKGKRIKKKCLKIITAKQKSPSEQLISYLPSVDS